MEEYTKSNFYFLQLLVTWKKQFVVVSVIAVVCAVIFSNEFFIKPKYKSFAIVYPSNITPYSGESQSEQMIQLLESADIRNHIIKKFNLIERYEIDSTAKSYRAALIKMYESNIFTSATKYQSVEIKAMDSDPQVACDMVNEIINALNLKARNLQREKTQEVLVVEANQLNLKKRQLDSLNADLVELRVKYQILDYGTQAKEVIKGYVKVLSSGKGSGNLKDLDVMMRNLEEKGGEYYEKMAYYNSSLSAYNTIKIEYDNVWKDMNKELTYTSIVTAPYPSDKKDYPVRWLIVLISLVSTNLFLYLLLVARDYRKRIIQ